MQLSGVFDATCTLYSISYCDLTSLYTLLYDFCCRLPLSSLNILCANMNERGPSLHFPISKRSNQVLRFHRCYLYPMSETTTMIPHRRSAAVQPMTIHGDGDGASAVGIPLVEYFANALGTSD